MSMFKRAQVTSDCIGRNIHELRNAEGKSRNTIANETGLPRDYIRNVEYGYAEATEKDLKAIAKALGVTTQELASDEAVVIDLDGESIRLMRKSLGVRQEGLSGVLNIPTRTIGDWELGKRQVPISHAQEMADFFNVPLEALINGEVDEYLDNDKAEELYEMAKQATNEEIELALSIMRFVMAQRRFR